MSRPPDHRTLPRYGLVPETRIQESEDSSLHPYVHCPTNQHLGCPQVGRSACRLRLSVWYRSTPPSSSPWLPNGAFSLLSLASYRPRCASNKAPDTILSRFDCPR